MSNYTKENLIAIPPTAVPAGTLAMKVGDEIFTPGNIRISAGGMDFYKCASVDTTNKTWEGYKAVLTDGVYTFEETATTGLTYGTAFTPSVDKIYNTDATVAVSKLHEGMDPTLVFYAPLTEEKATAETGQGMIAVNSVTYENGYANFASDAYINVTEGIGVDSDEYSVAFWVSRAGLSDEGYWGLCRIQGSYNIDFRRYNLRIYIGDSDLQKGTISATTWTHVVIVVGGGNAVSFIDGVQLGSASFATAVSSTDTLQIATCSGYTLKGGYMKDFRIYSRMLTANDVSIIMAENPPA